MKCIVDIEADDLIPTRIWCIVCKDILTGTMYKFKGDTLNDFRPFTRQVDSWIAHNGIAYDIPALNRLLNTEIKASTVEDTLVMSRLFNPTRSGGHSLESFGSFLNFPKGEFNDFSKYSDEMLKYCEQDVEVTDKVYHYLKREGKDFSPESIRLEHSVQYILEQQKLNGFNLNQEKAVDTRAACLQIMQDIEVQVAKDFKPKVKAVRLVVPKYKKDGSLSIVGLKVLDNPLEVVGGVFTLIEYVEFNLGSPKQVVERMVEYGWKPTVFNKPTPNMQLAGIKRGSPKVCEENINTLPSTAPIIAKKIGTYLMCKSRANFIEQWFSALGSDGRVHGTVFGVGANTHRMAHIAPNMATIPSVIFNKEGEPIKGVEGRFGFDCRSCFIVGNKRKLVGIDAKAIQLRVFAHYVNDPEYTDAMVNGDPHAFNRDALGLPKTVEGRAIAKTFIYAFLLGGGDPKLGEIVNGNARDGAALRARFMDRITGVKKLKQQNEEDARNGYIIGLDGRRLPIKSAHFALSSYLQGGEAVIMKAALVNWYNRVKRLKLDAMPVAMVHDEFQIDCAEEIAGQVGEIVVDSIRGTTKTFNLNCPMDGEASVGKDWASTH